MPLFSILIAVYNDWTALDLCLQSVSQQADGQSFEVIVVDDGSDDETPEEIRRWVDCLPLTIVRQPHTGISMARNRGVRVSQGSILLFVDADCRLQADCLSALATAIATSPTHNAFQLHLAGDGPGIVGRAEKLRLISLQNGLLQPSGCIRYLNTAGFAIRRSRVDVEKGLFDPAVIRAEDTLLLAILMEGGEMPYFVNDATISHVVSLSVMQCLRKDARSVYLESRAYDLIASRGVKVRMSHLDRLRMLSSGWTTAREHSIGRSAWFLLTIRQTMRIGVRFLTNLAGIRPRSPVTADSD
jgi:glycosyltransferase involved in cell wall biosynthesis